MKIRGNKKPLIHQNETHGWDNSMEEGYEERTKWYEEISPDPKKFQSVTDQVLIELKDEAKKCLDSETATYNIKNAKTNPDYRWMKTIMAKGTVSDKIASYTIMIQDNPVYNLDTIRNLINMVKVGKKKECIAVIETLSELFISDLLRPDIKLKPFYQRPLSSLTELSSGNAITRRKYLCYWYFEDQLKECYTTFVQALNKAAQDTVESNKEKAIAAMSTLLSGNPEQEKNLLSNIINKLGDPSQKVASKTMYCLTRLLQKHSNMQGVVLTEIEKLLFRPNVGHKAQYYSLCFLTQFYLNHEASDVARKLIEVYFSFFKKCIKEGEVDSRLMSALLTGVNRAYPYAKMELDKISEHIDTMYRVVHIASFTVSLHALTLLYQVSEYSDNINDRFYSALYKKLMDAKVNSTSHQALLLNLVYKSLMRDKERNRIAAFIKRLLQLCLHVQPSFACGILFLISQIITKKENAAFYVLKQSTIIEDDDDDGEEKYMDIKDENDTTENVQDDKQNKDEEDNEKIVLNEDQDVKPDVEVLNAKGSSWYHCATHKNTRIGNLYNPTARNPLYAGAEYSAYLELTQLKYHFHPSVSLFAEKVLKQEKISYSGDPLKDFTLIRFLDRFVFKNPKKQEEIQSNLSTFGKRKYYIPKGLRSLPLTSSNYLNESKKKIPVEEMFMFTYLKEKYKDRDIKDEEHDSDLESVASEEFEEMLDKMSGFKKVEDDDIDYMNEIGTLQESKKLHKKNADYDENDSEVESENEDDDDGIDDLSEDDNEIDHLSDGDNELSDDDLDEEDFNDDDEMNDDDKELLKDVDDDSESDIVFDSEEEDVNTKNKITKKLKKFNKDSIFASAEEFASILEDEGASGKASGTSHQLSNKDRADVKQLDWEEKRNRWLNGYDNIIGRGQKKFKGKPNFNKKRANTNKFSNKNKKSRKE